MPPPHPPPNQVRLALTSHSDGPVAASRIRQCYAFSDTDTEAQLLTAFHEILVNALNAHQRDRIDRPIDIALAAHPSIWTITDYASGFDSSRALAAPIPAPTATSGRGLLIASTFIPAITIVSGPVGTTVTLPVDEARWTLPTFESGPSEQS